MSGVPARMSASTGIELISLLTRGDYNNFPHALEGGFDWERNGGMKTWYNLQLYVRKYSAMTGKPIPHYKVESIIKKILKIMPESLR